MNSSSSCPPCPGGAPIDLHTLALLTTHQLTSTDPRFVGTKLRELIFTEPWLSTVAALVDAGEGRAERGFFFDAVDVEGELRGGREAGGCIPLGRRRSWGRGSVSRFGGRVGCRVGEEGGG